MSTKGIQAILAAGFAALVLAAGAQPASDTGAAKPAAPKKAEQKKAEPKKAEPKKAEPKKAEPKKAAAPKQEPKVYTNTPNKVLRDKDGNVIPTTPDAYDVSSAMPKKKP